MENYGSLWISGKSIVWLRMTILIFDLVPELPPSGGYENIVTAKDVFFRF